MLNIPSPSPPVSDRILTWEIRLTTHHEVTAWFDDLYASASRGERTIPWDRHAPNTLLTDWLAAKPQAATPGRAIVVGCGTGEDALPLVDLGYDVTAFDVSPTAIEIARQRHPQAAISFHVENLFDLPPEWNDAFDLVIESQDIQALPVELRDEAIRKVAHLVAPGGRLLVIAWADGRDGEGVDFDGPPWPLSRAHLDLFTGHGLELVTLDQIAPAGDDTIYRWRAEYHRP
jgi:SAM-dependent methyltransferase